MRSSSALGGGYFFALMGLAGLPDTFDLGGAVVVVGSALALALTFAWLLQQGAVAPALLPLMHGLAYFPGAWAYSLHGGSWHGLYVTPESIRDGLTTMTVFTCGGCVAGYFLAQTAPAQWLGRMAEKLAAPFGERAFEMALVTGLLLAAVLAYRANTISQYVGAERAAGTQGAKVGAHSHYVNVLGPFLVYAALRAYRAFDRGRIGIRPALPWIGLSLVGLLLLFVLQSRRLLIGLVLLVFLLVFRERQRLGETRITLRFVGASALAAGFVAAGLLLSLYWRAATQEGKVSNVLERTESAISYAERNEISASQVVATHRERLIYLESEGICAQLFDRFRMPWGALEATRREIEFVIPSVLNPSKGDSPPYRCEVAFAAAGFDLDVSCTPICTGRVVGGMQGILTAAILWTLAVMVAEAMPATIVGSALLTSTAWYMSGIETDLTPLFGALRILALLVALTGTLSVGFAMVLRRRPRPRQLSDRSLSP